jgi:hypothetical protein
MAHADIRPNSKGQRNLNPFENWSLEKKGRNRLSIRTVVGADRFEDVAHVEVSLGVNRAGFHILQSYGSTAEG